MDIPRNPSTTNNLRCSKVTCDMPTYLSAHMTPHSKPRGGGHLDGSLSFSICSCEEDHSLRCRVCFFTYKLLLTVLWMVYLYNLFPKERVIWTTVVDGQRPYKITDFLVVAHISITLIEAAHNVIKQKNTEEGPSEASWSWHFYQVFSNVTYSCNLAAVFICWVFKNAHVDRSYVVSYALNAVVTVVDVAVTSISFKPGDWYQPAVTALVYLVWTMYRQTVDHQQAAYDIFNWDHPVPAALTSGLAILLVVTAYLCLCVTVTLRTKYTRKRKRNSQWTSV